MIIVYTAWADLQAAVSLLFVLELSSDTNLNVDCACSGRVNFRVACAEPLCDSRNYLL